MDPGTDYVERKNGDKMIILSNKIKIFSRCSDQ
jgi:hypothetical protein